MKIVFLQQLWYEWQAPMTFSAIAKEKGHQTMMIINSSPYTAAKLAVKNGADLVVFSSITSGNMNYVYECAEKIKCTKDIPIIVGGVYVSLFYKEISLDHIDFLGIGEGETTFSCLLDVICIGLPIKQVPGLIYRINEEKLINDPILVCDINEIPIMDRDLYYKYALLRKEKVRMFYSGRGCAYNCSYCCVPLLNKVNPCSPQVRRKTPSVFIDEIMMVKNKYGMKAAFFQDDTFTQDFKWLVEFLPLYKKLIGKPFMCMSRAIHIDSQTADLLSKAGCYSVGIGIETANQYTRESTLNRFETNVQISNAFKMLKDRKIKVTTFNMLGIPSETLEDINNTLEFNSKNKVGSSWGVLFQPFVNNDTFINKVTKVSNTGNFYSELGYERPDKKQIVKIQKLFPMIVNHPWLKNLLPKVTPMFFANIIFLLYSFIREIRIWKRSFVITLLVGIRNQATYKRNNKIMKGGKYSGRYHNTRNYKNYL